MENCDAGLAAELENDNPRAVSDSASMDGIRNDVDALRVHERSSRSINRDERFTRDLKAVIRSEPNFTDEF